ncbi:hypothetical protein O181_046129 [Austropuccinia psidii MF-1]|uniref:Uncharacterized protein n=1 Tax=Austropuccinia psidii MF-1 TaxID=1389203 RepID=A0A9Q3DNH0_9BASI|nr:hypothetical protein [Austropuccinia psidii MF-1]
MESKRSRNKATIQDIEEKWSHSEHVLAPSGSEGVGKHNYPVDSKNSESRKSQAKSHHSSQFQKVSRRRRHLKGGNKTNFIQGKKEPDPMTQKLLDTVKEEHRNNK